MRLTLLFLLVSAPALAQEPKKYEFKFDFKVQKGQTFTLYEQDKNTSSTVVSADGQAIHNQKEEENTEFEARETVLDVREGKRAKVSWNFKKARHLVEGKEQPYGFEGKTVIATFPDKGDGTFTLEGGGELVGEDLEGVQAFSGNRGKDSPDADDIFAPKKPVAVGDSWSPDMPLLVKSMEHLEVDLEKSKGTLTLKSVDVIEGLEIGYITGKIELVLAKFGPMELKTPLTMTMELTVLTSMDRSRPQGTLKVASIMKGTSSGTLEDKTFDVEVDVSVLNIKRQTPAP